MRSSTSPTVKAGSITIRTTGVALHAAHDRDASPLARHRAPGERAELLLGEMTLDEKLAQLASVWVGAELGSGNVAPLQEAFAEHAPHEQASANGIGHFTRPLGTQPIDPVDGA